MRDDLNCAAEIVAAAFLVQHIPVHLACCKIGILIQILINKTLIVSEVEVSFSTVVSNENLTVLIR